MKLTHLQSSTEIIEIAGTRILTDPWLVDGEYYGSWYHYPPLPMAVADIDFDLIYISHIHPDHLSRKTLERLDRSKPVLIHNFEEKFLRRNIESLGFTVTELDHGAPYVLPGGGTIQIYSADNCDPELCAKFIDIDRCGGQHVHKLSLPSFRPLQSPPWASASLEKRAEDCAGGTGGVAPDGACVGTARATLAP